MSRIVDLRNLEKKGESRKEKRVIKNTDTKKKTKEIKWEADYGVYHSPAWQLGMIIFLLSVAVFFLIFGKNTLTAVFLFFLALIFAIRIKTAPKIIPISLQEHYLKFGEQSIAFAELSSFWITYRPNHIQELSLKRNKWHSFYIKIPMQNQNPMQIREFLINFIPEEKHENSIFDILTRNLGA